MSETIVYTAPVHLCKNVECELQHRQHGDLWDFVGTLDNAHYTVTFIDLVGLKVILIVHHWIHSFIRYEQSKEAI